MRLCKPPRPRWRKTTSALFWIGRDDKLEGILTDRDIIIRAVVDGPDATSVAVSEIMSSTLFTCREGYEVEAALREMTERQVRRLRCSTRTTS